MSEEINYTREYCLETLRELQKTYSDKSVTRLSLRNDGKIPESEWTRHFGTFTEFKEEAGIIPTKANRSFHRHIANVSSRLTWEEQNKDRWSWDSTFRRPNDRRLQTFVVGSDMHDEMCDPFYRRMFIQACDDTEADKVIFNGDLFDQPEISHYTERPVNYRPRERYKWVQGFLKDIRDVVPDAEFNLVEGNHEYRLVRHLQEKSPYVMDILDLQGWGAREFLGLDEFEVNYFSRTDFSRYTERDIQNECKRNYYKFRDIVLFHHFPEGRAFGMPGCSGHHHKFIAYSEFNATYGPYNWYQLGAGSRRYVDYTTRMGEPWNNGFMIVHVDLSNKKNTVFEYVDCTGEFAFLNGKRYQRSINESVFLVQ